MTTKYEVLKESAIEMKLPSGAADYEVRDLEEFTETRTERYPKLIKQFDTLEEARRFFEKEKKYCDTRLNQGYVFRFFEFDQLILAETEYDEDEDIIQSELWSSYIADDECLHNI
jgi:hypothetical protein